MKFIREIPENKITNKVINDLEQFGFTFMNKWLVKALNKAKSFDEIKKIISVNPTWYGLPKTYTLKDLSQLYEVYKKLNGKNVA